MHCFGSMRYCAFCSQGRGGEGGGGERGMNERASEREFLWVVYLSADFKYDMGLECNEIKKIIHFTSRLY